MNKLIAATALLLVVSGNAFAAEETAPAQTCAQVATDRSANLDCSSTASLKAATDADKSDWGLAINPWIVPTFN